MRSLSRPATAPAMNTTATITSSAQPSRGGPCPDPSGPAARPSMARLAHTTATAAHSTRDNRVDSTHAATIAVTANDPAIAAATT